MRGVLIALGLIGGCGDEAVSLVFKPPTDVAWDTSCVDHVEVYADGASYPSDDLDYKRTVLTIASAQDFASIETALRGKIDIAIPDSGFSGVEIYGWAGISGFDDAATVSELVFSGYQRSVGQNPLEVNLVPTVSCLTHDLVVRPLDVVKFVQTPTCATSGLTAGSVEIGSITPARYQPGLLYWGSPTPKSLVSGATTITGPTTVGPDSCAATRIHDGDVAGTVGCINYATGACGGNSEIEVAYIDPVYAANSIDPALVKQYGAAMVGLVTRSNGTKNVPFAGATVTVNSDAADTTKVVYVDLQTTGSKLAPTTGTATTASGLFLVYSNELVSLTIAGGGTTKTVNVGSATLASYMNTTVIGAVSVSLNGG